jgi:hypothetical protein
MTTPAEGMLTTKAVAERLNTDAKTLRVFLRASDDYQAVGSGSRYSFTAKGHQVPRNQASATHLRRSHRHREGRDYRRFQELAPGHVSFSIVVRAATTAHILITHLSGGVVSMMHRCR